jgi:4-hydroxy-2-oxoheptanedioate aldolase
MPSLDAVWAEGRAAIGLWCSLADSAVHEIVGTHDVDYVCTDLQHGFVELAGLHDLLRASGAGGAIPLVRIASNEPWIIGRVLDMGAAGVIVPLIDDAQSAARAVAACRYPPLGGRSYGPIRAGVVAGTADPAVLGQVACIPMIETLSGLDNVEEIAAVDGVTALYVGPADLGISLGLVPGVDDPLLTQALERVLSACRDANIPAGLHCLDGHGAARALAMGFQMVTVTSDVRSMREGLAAQLAAARAG